MRTSYKRSLRIILLFTFSLSSSIAITQLVNGGSDFCTPSNPCGKCEGDCDKDDDCKDNLICHHRDHGEPTPDGCNGTTNSRNDYCVEKPNLRPTKPPTPHPPTSQLVNGGSDFCTPSNPCGKCEGDCDKDDDCKDNLICHHRDKGDPTPDGCNGTTNSGNDYCVEKQNLEDTSHPSNSIKTLIGKLTDPDGEAEDYFGSSVSLSGDIVAIGSPRDDDNGDESGSVYIFRTTDGHLDKKLTAPDGSAGNFFGSSVSLSEDIVAIGSPGDDSGSVYLFRTTDGHLDKKLTAPDGVARDQFGSSVSLSGEVVAIGAPYDDDSGEDSGSVYLFNTTDGQLIKKLTAPDGEAEDYFGSSVSLSGDKVAIGAPKIPYELGRGSVYIFRTTDGHLDKKLTAPDSAEGDNFGYSVSLLNDIVAVGAPYDGDFLGSSGSAYIFRTTDGHLIKKITDPNAQHDDLFGTSVSLSGDVVAVGSNTDDSKDEGVFVYLYRTTDGKLIEKLTADDVSHWHGFGFSVSLFGDMVVVGAPFDNDNVGSGSVYMFGAGL